MTTLAEQVASRVDAILARLDQPAPRPQADDAEAAVWWKCAAAAKEAAGDFEMASPEHRGAWRVYAAVLATDEGGVWASTYAPGGGG